MDKPTLPVVQQQQARIDSVEGIRLATIKFMGRVYPSESLPASNIFIISGSVQERWEEVAAVCIFRARNPCRGGGFAGDRFQEAYKRVPVVFSPGVADNRMFCGKEPSARIARGHAILLSYGMDHGLAVRASPVPDIKGFCGLFHQHPEAIVGMRHPV